MKKYTQKFREMRSEIIGMISADHPLAADMSALAFLEMLVSRYPSTMDRAGYSPIETGFFTTEDSHTRSHRFANDDYFFFFDTYCTEHTEALLLLLDEPLTPACRAAVSCILETRGQLSNERKYGSY